ncbi:MAG: EAL domain-containing protein [Coriobacteriia bacterium]|nr:EAL domain-containing protein [Coriobacteriia bacterium]
MSANVLAVVIFAVGALVQIAAAGLALLLIPLSGKQYAWILLTCGLILQVWRRLYIVLVWPSQSLLHESISALFVSTFMLLGIVGIRSIFRSMKETAERLRIERGRIQEYLDLTDAIVLGLDAGGRIVLINRAGARILGAEKDALDGENWYERFVPAERRCEGLQLFSKFMQGEAEPVACFESPIVTTAGDRRSVVWHNAMQRDEDGRITGTLSFGIDITERKEAEAAVERMACHDALTGLPNRTLFEARAELMIAGAQCSGKPLALLLFDVDDLRGVNDRYGHAVADQLLRMVANRISDVFRKEDTIARVAGDEFGVLLPVRDKATADVSARKALKALRRPYRIYAKEIRSTVSVGIALYPKDAEDIDGLLRRADAAARKVGQSGGNGLSFYVSGMRDGMMEKLSLRDDLAAAVEHKQFVLHYQPQMCIDTGEMIGAEALIRWNHPKRGLVVPTSFICLLEESGLIETVGEWVIREACAQAVAWQEQGFKGLRMAVNTSARQFRDSEFLQTIRSALDCSGLEPEALQLEITETMAIEDPEEAIAIITGINAIGATVAVDDFGTGHSSLAYLRRFPVQTLKIDRAFVMDLDASEDDRKLVSSMIGLAHDLHLEVVAEGVETEGQLAWLQEYGCDHAQGFLYRPPLTVEEFAAFMNAEQTSGLLPTPEDLA